MDDSQQWPGKSPQCTSTNPQGWRSFCALQSHLADRLERFTRMRTKTRHSRPETTHNEGAFFEADLHYVFKRPTAALYSLSSEFVAELDRHAHNLLGLLDDIVSDDLLDELLNDYSTNPNSPVDGPQKSSGSTADVEMLDDTYPKLAELIHLLRSSSGEFRLIGSDGISIFKHPSEDAQRQAARTVAEWISFLDQLEATKATSSHHRDPISAVNSLAALKPMGREDLLQKRASIVVEAIFKEFQRLNCHREHELKLKITEKWYTNPAPAAVEMFISCCQSSDGWHEAQCGKFNVRKTSNKEEDVCHALRHARSQSLKLFLLIDERGLFNITNDLPPVTTSTNNYQSESLDYLLDQKAFSRLSFRNYLDGTAMARFDAREKASLALVLSRCLMDFFGDSVDLASYTWNPVNIFVIDRHLSEAKACDICVSMKPAPGHKLVDFAKTVRPGNPVLLSFAKLLLEIHWGEKIPLEIGPQNIQNFPVWAKLCKFLQEAQRDEASHYLEAIDGCLNLHKHMLKYRVEGRKMTGLEMREMIYQQIVSNLENASSPTRLKRKRSDSAFNSRLGKRKPFHESAEESEDEEYPEAIQTKRYPSTQDRKTVSRDTTMYESRESDNMDTSLAKNHRINGAGPDHQIRGSVGHVSLEIPSCSRNEYSTCATTKIEFNSNPFSKYTVAIICAIEYEMSAFRYMLDKEHPGLPRIEGDSNIYTLGELHNHNIVLACLPGSQGKGAAATVVTHLVRTFTGIKWRFMVGIGGGVPSAKHDIRLGDIVVSMPEGIHGGVVQYDLGKDRDDKFDYKGFLMPPPPFLRNAVQLMESDRWINDNKINENLLAMVSRSPRLRKYAKPPVESDVLYPPGYNHISLGNGCERCDIRQAVQRKPREFEGPEIHYGLIASGDRVIRSAVNRDAIIRDLGDILCFEMEAAGLTVEHSFIVIRGISDYADSHKNDLWHYYAAATAAAYAKELLLYIGQ